MTQRNSNDSELRTISELEFCRYCGAGIGKFRRYGEGTCHVCDPEDRAKLDEESRDITS